jgi:hypothetical protein
MTDTRAYEAGHVLSAVEALADGRELFTRGQVSQLLAMAFDSGRTASYREDLAELHSRWEDATEPRRTYEQRVQQRITQMEEAAEMTRLRAGLPPRDPYLGGPVEWIDDGTPYNVLTRRDRDVIAAAEKIPPIGNQAQPGTREYAQGWREMRERLTPRQWENLTTGEYAPIGPRTLAAIKALDDESGAPAVDPGQRRLRLVKTSGGAA